MNKNKASLLENDSITKNCANFDRKHIVKAFFITVFFNTLIALFLTGIGFGDGFYTNFIISQCIGICIFTFVMLVNKFLLPQKKLYQMMVTMAAIILATIIGGIIGVTAVGINPQVFLDRHGPLVQTLTLGLMFGAIITYFFLSKEKISIIETDFQKEKIKRLMTEKIAAETELRLLQAQMEPHFLFNTLSNILSLLDSDVKKGKFMLMDLTKYLRESLSSFRADENTLGHEMDLIESYLNIFKLRMGKRLKYDINVSKSVFAHPFPPMLIQPLVENAIKHGLEPKISGGEILIQAKKVDDCLTIEISDTGKGMKNSAGRGMGLQNIQERLQTIYGNQGKLVLKTHKPDGLKAVIVVPYGLS